MTDSNGSRRPRVLVVDDEPLICEVIRMMLEDKNDVVVAGAGPEAKRLLETDANFDVIFCDLMMAGVSGIDLHTWLVATRPQLAARMVFMTGGASSLQAKQFVERVPNRFIAKPLAWASLEEAVQQVFTGP